MNRNLFLYEWHKLTASRFLWLLCTALLIVNSIVCWVNTPPDESAALMDAVWEQYRGDPDSMEAYAAQLTAQQEADIQRQLEALQNGQTVEPAPPICTFDPDGQFSDLALIGRVKQAATGAVRQTVWEGQMRQVIRNAQENKRELTATLGVSEDSYAFRHQDNAEKIYTALLGTVTFCDGFSRGWDTFFNYEPIGLFIAAAAILGTVVIFAAEQDGSAVLLRAYKKGRGHTATAKLCAALFFSVCAVLAFLLSTGAAVSLRVGLSDPRQAIQAFSGFEYVPFAWTVADYLVHFILAKLLSAAVLSLLTAVVMILSGRPAVAFSISVLTVAGGYALYHSHAGELWRQLDPYAYSLYVPLSSRYLCFPVGEFLGKQLSCLRLALCVLSVLLFAAGAFIFAHKYPTARKSRFGLSELLHAWREKLSARLPERRRQTRGHIGLVRYEWRKQVMNPRFLILFVVVLALQSVLIIRRTEPNYSYHLAIYRDYLTIVEGEQTPEKSAWIENENAFICDTINREHTNESLFLSGEMDGETYFAYLEDLSYANTHAAAFARVAHHEQYLTDLQTDKDVRGIFLFEDDWLTYLTAGVDWLLLLFVLFTVSGTFADEYSAQSSKDPVRSLIRSTKRGRQDTFKAKMSFAAVLSAALVIIFEAMETITAFARLSLDHLSSPLLSVELFQFTDGTLSLMTFVIIRLLMRFVGLMIASMLVLAFGELFRRKVYAVCAAALVVAVPFVCRKFGITFMSYLDLTLLLDGTDLWLFSTSHGAKDFIIMTALTAGFALLTAVLLVLVNRRYAENRRKGAAK